MVNQTDHTGLYREDWRKYNENPYDFSVREMIAGAISSVGAIIRERHQKCIVDIGGNVPSYIVTDQEQMCRMTSDLLENACLNTPRDGKVCLWVCRLPDKEGMCRLRLAARDNGFDIEAALGEDEETETRGSVTHYFS